MNNTPQNQSFSLLQQPVAMGDLMKQIELQLNGSEVNYLVQIPDNVVQNVEEPQFLLENNQIVFSSQIGAINETQKTDLNINKNEIIYQIVYPEELNLRPTERIEILKRGRPKRKKIDKFKEEIVEEISPSPPIKTTRTRSGRLVKFPKNLGKDYKKIEMNKNPEFNVKEFEQSGDDNVPRKEMVLLDKFQKKRKISSQYTCPKCHKRYMGKRKIIGHLQKNPDHGPIPFENNQNNFEVWNYLVETTQKLKPGERGQKFCEEITNLLHNVKLLKNALFKICAAEENHNFVQVDNVLGCALGMSPGKYKFEENELHKDVTVFNLFSSGFFKPNLESNENDINTSAPTNLPDSGNIEPVVDKSAKNAEKNTSKNTVDVDSFLNKNEESCDNTRTKTSEEPNTENMDSHEPYQNKKDNFSAIRSPFTKIKINEKTKLIENQLNQLELYKTPIKSIDLNEGAFYTTKILDDSNAVDDFVKKNDHHNISDILSDNMLLTSMQTNDLILTNVDSGGHLLDNSASSDEVMNVDQFVNERFKKITESDVDLSNTSLNLDLPSLEMFNFNES